MLQLWKFMSGRGITQALQKFVMFLASFRGVKGMEFCGIFFPQIANRKGGSAISLALTVF